MKETDEEENAEAVQLEHHKQQELCVTRAAYRQGRRLTAVKIYTVSSESMYLLIFGVPSINLRPELKNLCQKYGGIKSLTCCTEYPTEDFTECYRIKYERIQSARIAKKMIDMKNFYGGTLHVCYAPEFETVDETRAKLVQRRIDVTKRLQINSRNDRFHYNKTIVNNVHCDVDAESRLMNAMVKVNTSNFVEFPSPHDNFNRCIDPDLPECILNTVNDDNNTNSFIKNDADTEKDSDSKEYVFKTKRKRKNSGYKKKKIDSKSSRVDEEACVIGPMMTDRDRLSEIGAIGGRVVVCEAVDKPRIVKIPEKPVNRIIFNINSKQL